MPVPATNIKAVFDRLTAAALTGQGPPDVPWGDKPSVDAIAKAIDGAADALPFVYRRVYVDEVRAQLPAIVRSLAEREPEILETLAGAVYDHDAEEVAAPLGRFLAVVSNLYRSFLDAETRTKVDLPLIEQLPPLAMFQHAGGSGPFTLTAETVARLCGSNVGVVSMPSACRDHPFTWVSLAHETGGHDVLHADPGLLDELAAGVREFFGGGHIGAQTPSGGQLLGLLWSYWIDEAASDVYGVLNMGPQFAMNLVVFLAAFIASFEGGTEPVLRSETGRDTNDVLDSHPVDLLRPHLAIGVVQALTGLDAKVRDDYVATLEQMARDCSGGADSIALVGQLPVGDGRALILQNRFPLDEMEDAARRVGSFIASAKLRSLGGHRIQDLETWDDLDETAARRIADTLAQDASAVGIGDDAQILAGATRAILDEPGKYDQVTRRVNEALDESFARDPIWATAQPDRLWEPIRRVDPGYFLDRYSADIHLLRTDAPKVAAAA